MVLIASNSGRNGAIVELALECRRRGIYSAAFTSRAHSMAVVSRHESGLRLLEVTDDVVDNHCPLGDGTVDIPGVGAVSRGNGIVRVTCADVQYGRDPLFDRTWTAGSRLHQRERGVSQLRRRLISLAAAVTWSSTSAGPRCSPLSLGTARSLLEPG